MIPHFQRQKRVAVILHLGKTHRSWGIDRNYSHSISDFYSIDDCPSWLMVSCFDSSGRTRVNSSNVDNHGQKNAFWSRSVKWPSDSVWSRRNLQYLTSTKSFCYLTLTELLTSRNLFPMSSHIAMGCFQPIDPTLVISKDEGLTLKSREWEKCWTKGATFQGALYITKVNHLFEVQLIYELLRPVLKCAYRRMLGLVCNAAGTRGKCTFYEALSSPVFSN
jgi:hypothetical protein